MVAIYDRVITRAICLRRYDDISANRITRWPVTLHIAADDLDADRARRVAAELLAAADLIDTRSPSYVL